MTHLGKRISFVFDSFIVPDFQQTTTSNGYTYVSHRNNTVALIISGIRIQGKNGNSFQFGFAGLYMQEEMVPLPIPSVQWLRQF
jgi:hypothetical protein